MTVIAHDIDGALTRRRVRDDYLGRKSRGVVVGIVSARSPAGIEEFLAKRDLPSDFARSGKSLALERVREQFPDHERYIYRGSWFRDRVAATLAGWEYESASPSVFDPGHGPLSSVDEVVGGPPGALIGGVIGHDVGGPVGAVAGAAIGWGIGEKIAEEETNDK